MYKYFNQQLVLNIQFTSHYKIILFVGITNGYGNVFSITYDTRYIFVKSAQSLAIY